MPQFSADFVRPSEERKPYVEANRERSMLTESQRGQTDVAYREV